MSVPAVNLRIEKGTDFEATFNVFDPSDDPLLLNNFTGSDKIRKYPSSPTSHSFTVSITSSNLEVDSEVISVPPTMPNWPNLSV